MAQKKVRATNFSTDETNLLIELIEKHKSVIECGKTDKVNMDMKNKYWRKIEIAFNSQSGKEWRDLRTLKKKYENFKKRMKKHHTEERNSLHTNSTSDDPLEISSVPIDKEIKEAIIINTMDEKLMEEKQKLEIKLLEKENEKLKRSIEIMNEEHNLGMKIKAEKHEKEIKILEEKHALELERLNLEIEIKKKQLLKFEF